MHYPPAFLNMTECLQQSIAIKTVEDTEDSSDTQSSTDEWMPDALSPQENTVDSTVNTEQQGKESEHAFRSTS